MAATFSELAEQLNDYLIERKKTFLKNYFDTQRIEFVNDLISVLNSDTSEFATKKIEAIAKIDLVLKDPNKFGGKNLRSLLVKIRNDLDTMHSPDEPKVLAHLTRTELYSQLDENISENTSHFNDQIDQLGRREHANAITALLQQAPITINFTAYSILSSFSEEPPSPELARQATNVFTNKLTAIDKTSRNADYIRTQQSLFGGRNVAEEKYFLVNHANNPRDVAALEIKSEEQFNEWISFFAIAERQGVECNVIDHNGHKHRFPSIDWTTLDLQNRPQT